MMYEEFVQIQKLPLKEASLKIGELYAPTLKPEYGLSSEEVADQFGPIIHAALRERKKSKESYQRIVDFFKRFQKV